MLIKINISIILIVCLLFTGSAAVRADGSSCSGYIDALGIPINPKTVMEFEYLSVAIGDLKANAPHCIPNTSENSLINFERLFSEKVIENVINTYSSYQVVQMALVDLKTTISAISSWYVAADRQYAIERAKFSLLQLYVMIRSLELYSQNMQTISTDAEPYQDIKSFVYNEIRIIEAYIAHNKFFGDLNANQHFYVKSKMVEYLKRLKSVPLLINDNGYQMKLDITSNKLTPGSKHLD